MLIFSSCVTMLGEENEMSIVCVQLSHYNKLITQDPVTVKYYAPSRKCDGKTGWVTCI